MAHFSMFNRTGFFAACLSCASIVCLGVLPLRSQAISVAGNKDSTTVPRTRAAPPQPAPAAAQTTPKIDDCALTDEERLELSAAVDSLGSERSPRRILEKLIKNRRPSASATATEIAGYRELLPEEFKTRILTDAEIAADPASRRVAEIARRVFARHQITDRSVLLYHSERPFLATWKTHLVLVSTGAIRMLTETELAGQLAHEAAHLYFLTELNQALESDDYPTARIIELRCDLIAMLTLRDMGMNSAAVDSGLSKMISFLLERNEIKPVPTHPSLCARAELSKVYQTKFTLPADKRLKQRRDGKLQTGKYLYRS